MTKDTTLTVANLFNDLANKELAQKCINIHSLEAQTNGISWVLATEYTNIVNNEEFEDDFDSVAQFAEFMGKSKGYISQCKTAVEFITNNDLFSPDTLSVGKATILGGMRNKNEEEYNKFIEWCNANDRDIRYMSDGGLKKIIKEWRKDNEAIDVENVVVEEATEETATGEKATGETSVNVDIVTIEYNGNNYDIPLSVLEQYKVNY